MQYKLISGEIKPINKSQTSSKLPQNQIRHEHQKDTRDNNRQNIGSVQMAGWFFLENLKILI